jgi:hypothetical protein
VTGTRARSHDETVDALAAEGLPALQDTLTGLAPQEVFHLIDPGGAPTSHSGPHGCGGSAN